MTELERYIFEQSVVVYDTYRILQGIDFKESKIQPRHVLMARPRLEIFLNSSNSEICRRNTKVDFGETTLYQQCARFKSDYLDDYSAYNIKAKNSHHKRKIFYSGIENFLYYLCCSLQESLTEYSGDNKNVYMAGQGVLLLLKGIFVSNRLKTINGSLPKDEFKGELHNAILTTKFFIDKLPDELEQIISGCENFAGLQVLNRKDATIVNTICTLQEIEDIHKKLKSTIITNKQEEIIKDACHISSRGSSNNTIEESLANSLRAKAETLLCTLPDEIYMLRKRIEDNLKLEFDDVAYFIGELLKESNINDYYNRQETKAEEKTPETTNKAPTTEKTISNETYTPTYTYRKSNFSFKKILKALALPFIWLGKGIYTLFRAIGKGFIKVFKTIGKFFAELFSNIGRFFAKHKVIASILIIVVIATPIATYFILHKPCHYEDAVVTIASTCESEGKATVTCVEHGETKEITLPKRHTVGADNTCSGCGEVFDFYEEKYIPNYPEHTDIRKCVYGYIYIDTLETPSYSEGEPLEQIHFDSVEIDTVIVYSHDELDLRVQDCKITNLYIVGNIKSIDINNKDVENVIVYGNAETINVLQKSKIDTIAATGEIQYIISEK